MVRACRFPHLCDTQALACLPRIPGGQNASLVVTGAADGSLKCMQQLTELAVSEVTFFAFKAYPLNSLSIGSMGEDNRTSRRCSCFCGSGCGVFLRDSGPRAFRSAHRQRCTAYRDPECCGRRGLLSAHRRMMLAFGEGRYSFCNPTVHDGC